MSLVPEPWWPVVALALVSAVDALLCVRPVAFVAQCFRDVGWPESWWWVMPPLKLAGAVGLVAGIWIPGLALLTTLCLVAYFLIAIAMHVRARDFGRNLFVNASGMLVLCVSCVVWCFVV